MILKPPVLIALSLGLASCGSVPGPDPATVAAATAPVVEPRPVRVAVLVDQTSSTQSTGVPRLEVSDFEPLLSLLAESGGEIAVGAIRERSNQSLLRCRFEQQPRREAQEPDARLNAFLRDKAMRTYRAQKQEEDQREQAWREKNQQRLAEFREKLEALLDRPADARRTDIRGAVLRAERFLNEPEDGWRRPPLRVQVWVSDGQDNVGAPEVAITSGAALLMVNGTSDSGVLQDLKPLPLESFAAVIRYIDRRAKEE